MGSTIHRATYPPLPTRGPEESDTAHLDLKSAGWGVHRTFGPHAGVGWSDRCAQMVRLIAMFYALAHTAAHPHSATSCELIRDSRSL